ncbi:5-dehydro-4-deoxyglucarate dehydratase [Actinoplanes sp. ATCC 53533]|uniref:5-dehydro-4-deoxyglucarate dehydratase n=1 Tax=Actinoplanes sp. ATCC 53533 TaxID=1288362 RepID=UPI002101D537|nr:5-dehydro-4-deoxyglucarate dehydratase [Actinoplanes sp. ATCC 53533]
MAGKFRRCRSVRGRRHREGFSLTSAEMDRVVRAAVSEVGSALPVVRPATGGTAQATDQAIAAQRAGAAGLLLLPPYLTEATQAGLIAHVTAVCRATELGVIVYSRANAVLDDVTVAELADRNPNLIGLKDGVGDIERMTRTYARLGDRLIYIGGLPTAETFALPLLQLGVSTYSSALYNFLPEYALRFFAAVRAQDRDTVYQLLNDFIIPYLDIRDRARGYAVSIIKAGLTAVGRDGGRVRPPLTDLTPAERADLTALIEKVRA